MVEEYYCTSISEDINDTWELKIHEWSGIESNGDMLGVLRVVNGDYRVSLMKGALQLPLHH